MLAENLVKSQNVFRLIFFLKKTRTKTQTTKINVSSVKQILLEGYEVQMPVGQLAAVDAAGPSSGPAPEDCSCSPPTGRRSGGCAAL